MKLTDLLSPIPRPFGISGPKRVFNGIEFRPGKLSGVKTDLQDVVLKPRTPLPRPLGTSGSERVFNGIELRPGKLSSMKTDLQDVVLRPRTLNRPSSSSNEQKREYITSGLSVEENVLNLENFNLIGVFGPPEDREALVLSPRGKITRLKVGSKFQRGRVISIGKDQLVYIRDNKNYVFRMKN